jgi:hypothetical protein
MEYHSGKLIEDNQMVDCTGIQRRGKLDPTIGIGGVEKELRNLTTDCRRSRMGGCAAEGGENKPKP